MKYYTHHSRQIILIILFSCLTAVIGEAQTLNPGYYTSYQKKSMTIQKGTRLIKALRILEDKFDVVFLYRNSVIKHKKLAHSVFVANNIRRVLKKILQGQKLAFEHTNPRTYGIYPEQKGRQRKIIAIQQKVNGTVTDAGTGKTLPGVNVVVQGTQNGVSTGSKGRFELSVESLQDTLVFSFVGYQTKRVAINGQTTINVTLKPAANSLNNLVVVGYGAKKKKNLTGSIATVSASELQDAPVTRLDESLQGRTSGVRVTSSSGAPGAASTVRIRGTTSINNSNPLYVIDGVPVDNGGISYLNPSDIKSIQVLKDAASAAIYGTESASGVVLVTTKKGRPGQLQVHYNGYAGFQQPAKKLDLLNATQYATLRNESSVAAGNGRVFQNPQSLGAGTDWQKTIFNDQAAIMNHDLSFSGGSDKATYFASVGYYDEEGIVASPISHDKKLSFRINSNLQPKKWLTFGENFGYTYERTRGSLNTNSEFGGPLSSAINLDPVTPIVVTNPNTINSNPYSNNPVVLNDQGNPYGISQYVGQEITNPLAYIQTQLGNFGYSHNIVGNVYASVDPIEGLEIRTDIGVKPAFYGNENFTPIYYLNASTNNLVNNNFFRAANQGLIYNWDNTVKYIRDFGNHHFDFLVGSSIRSNNGLGVNATFQGIPVSNFNNASLNFSVPTANRVAGGFENQPFGLNSYFGRLVYNYKDTYLLTGVLRIDGSSRFGSNNRYGRFPAVSAGWVPTNEDFWPDTRIVNYLKIRASYGINGNDKSLGDFQYESTISGGRNYIFGLGTIFTGSSPNAPANPNLKWEQTSQLDLGFDANLFNDFTVTFDFYNKKTSDELLQIQIPAYVGATGNPFGNVASLTDKGVEVELGYQKQVGAFNVKVNGNASYNENTVTDIGNNDFLTGATFQASAFEISRTQVGEPVGEFYGFKNLGIFQTQQAVDSYVDKNGNKIQPNAQPGDFRRADLNGDGRITSDDRTFLGNPTPPWTFGITAGASWHNFDLRIFGQGVYGNKIFQGLRRLDITTANYTTAALGRWTGPGTSNSFPRLDDADPNNNFTDPSSFYLSDGSYFRVKYLQIGYSLPVEISNNIGVRRARIYLMSRNLVTLTGYSGYDPEIGGSSFSIDRGVYPQARSYLLGLDISF